tara:strand:+ start:218 stop:394 length:177 start_codon:yes stop_codon:yes gene_type:complete
MKIAFIGAVEFSRRTLELLIEMKQDVVGVCALKDSPFNSDHAQSTHVYTGLVTKSVDR